MMNNWIEWLALIASVLTIISICVNIIQRNKRTELLKALRSRSQASYNYFYRIARLADKIRFLNKSEDNLETKLQNAISYAHFANGVADTARNDIVAFSREHLDFIPIEEHPAEPILDPLPRPGRTQPQQLSRAKAAIPSWQEKTSDK